MNPIKSAGKMAGKYVNTLPMSLAAAALGAGGSVAGNIIFGQGDKDPNRIALEALGAAGAGGLAGLAVSKAVRPVIGDIIDNGVAYMASRGPIPMNIEEMSKGIKNIYTNATAVSAALTAGGLGGMIGGGVANLAGIPLRQPAKTSENVKEYLAQLQMENDMMQSGEAMYA
jgi:hypothetical protein